MSVVKAAWLLPACGSSVQPRRRGYHRLLGLVLCVVQRSKLTLKLDSIERICLLVSFSGQIVSDEFNMITLLSGRPTSWPLGLHRNEISQAWRAGAVNTVLVVFVVVVITSRQRQHSFNGIVARRWRSTMAGRLPPDICPPGHVHPLHI